MEKRKTTYLKTIKALHGGYWRYDLLDFHYLYNSYFPNETIRKTLAAELSDLMDHYPSTQKVVGEILSQWQDEPWFCQEHLIVGNGSSELIRILNGMLVKVAVPVPTFNEYTQIAADQINYFYTKEEDDFRLNVNRLKEFVLRKDCRTLILNNPNNPTGQLFARDEIEQFLRLGILVIVDEAFIDWSGAEFSCEALIEKYDNLVVIKSLTKTTGTGGLRLGYLLTANEKVRKSVLKQLPIWNINSIAERFLELLVEQKAAFLQSVEKGRADREWLLAALKNVAGVTPLPSAANFIFCRYDGDAVALEEKLFRQERILIKAGVSQQRLESRHFFRIGVRTRMENQKLIDALERI